MKSLLSFLYLLCFLRAAEASCPNHCNSKGLCDKFSRCTCSAGFQGADCSERICPFGIAWSDEATGTDDAHALAECSNRGICDRTNAKCSCMEGFSGSACERLNCHDDCNGKGICFSMKDFATRTKNSLSLSYEYSSVWDAEKIKGCVCDSGKFGYDCSLVLCPNGDDPLTLSQVNEKQLLKCTATQGSFVLNYNGKPSRSISYNANAAAIRTALLAIPELTGVKVSFSQVHGTACQLKPNIITIEFTEQFGELNPLVPFLDPTLTANGGTLIVSADGVSILTDVSGTQFKSVKGTKERDLCANRGICDTGDGTCNCFNTNGDAYDSSDGYGKAGVRGDCGFVLSSSTTAVSTCPGDVQCSGHGVCDQSSFRCTCSVGWQGGDCSEKVCPSGLSWFAYPSDENAAHDTYDLCSNMGVCDYSSGNCQCRDGFYGQACEYMACGGGVANPCNGHGRCMTMAELALWANDNGDATEFVYGSDPNDQSTWDYDRVHGCLCDQGFSGYDCSLIDCPRGDDPGTYDDHVEVQLLQCIADAGNFTLSFRQAVTPVLSYNITATELESALSSLSTIGRVEVYFIQDGLPPNGTLNDVELKKAAPAGYPEWLSFVPNYYKTNNTFMYVAPLDNTGINSAFCKTDGKQIAILNFQYTHGDLPAVIADTSLLGDYDHYNGEPGSGKITVATDGQSIKGMQSIKGTTETDICNNRGLCDTTRGECRCFETWTSSDGGRQGKPGNMRDCGLSNFPDMTESRPPDFEPPIACVSRVIKSVLPDNILVTKDARLALVRATGIFMFYLTHCANDFCKDNKRQTIYTSDVINALKELGFEDFEGPLVDFLDAYKKQSDNKTSISRPAKRSTNENNSNGAANAPGGEDDEAAEEDGEGDDQQNDQEEEREQLEQLERYEELEEDIMDDEQEDN